MAERIEAFNNNCTLVAVKFVLNGTKTDDELLAAFRAEGYIDNHGMRHERWTGAAERLGLQLEKVKIPRKEGKYVRQIRATLWDDQDLVQRWVPGRYTLAEFCRDHPVGTFFVSLRAHAVVVTNGKLWDPNCANQTMARGVEAAKRVINAPEIKVGGAIKWIPRGKAGSKTGARRASALAYIKKCEDVNMGERVFYPDAEELIANSDYTRADYEWDLARGNIRFVQ